MKQVFISYSEEDSEVALGLARQLRVLGVTTWTYEENGLAGHSYLEQVHTAIRASDAFILLASASSLESHQVTREAETAYESQKLIIPVRLGISPTDLANRAIFRMVSGTAVSIPVTLTSFESTASRINASLQRVAGVGPIPPLDPPPPPPPPQPQQKAEAPSNQATTGQASSEGSELRLWSARTALAICASIWAVGGAWTGLMLDSISVRTSGAAYAAPPTPTLQILFYATAILLLADLFIFIWILVTRRALRATSSAGLLSDGHRLRMTQLIVWALMGAVTYTTLGELGAGIEISAFYMLVMALVWTVLWKLTRRTIRTVQSP